MAKSPREDLATSTPPSCSRVIKYRLCPSLRHSNQQTPPGRGTAEAGFILDHFSETQEPNMSARPEVICVHNGIDLDFDSINAARSECDGLDLNTTASHKVFQPGEKCMKIIDSVKRQISQKTHGRSVHVTLSGDDTPYLRPPCIAIPIKTKGLPNTMITRSGANISVDWEAGMAWEILQDVRTAPIHEGGGILILLYLEK